MPEENSTVFNNEPTKSEPTSPFLVVGERVFNKPDDVANKLNHADSHIKTLEAENAAARAELEALKQSRALDEEKFNQLVESLNHTNSQATSDQTRQNVSLDQEALTKAAQSAVQAQLAKVKEEESQRTFNANIEAINQEMIAAHENIQVAQAAIQATASELNMTVEEAMTLAGTKPEVFRRLFGIAKKAGSAPTPSSPTATHTGIKPTTTYSESELGHLPDSEIYKLMKEDRKNYPKYMREMMDRKRSAA